MLIISKEQFQDVLKKTQLVLFDLDNTLIELKVDWITVKQYFNDLYLRHYGKALLYKTFSENFSYIEQMHGKEALKPFLDYLKQQEYEAAQKYAKPLWLLNEGLKKLEKYIPEKTIYGVISNNFNQTITTILDRFKIRQRFTILSGRDNVVHTKPHPEGILQVLEQQKILPANCLFIGDHETDQKAAEAANVNFVFVQKIQEFYK